MLGIARIAAALGLILAVGAETRASCVTDAGEPDDQCVAAAAVVLGGSSQPRNFCDDATDWVTFNGCPGRGYTVETSGLGVAADTVLELYDRDCSTLLATDDDGAGGRASRISNWVPGAAGSYHVRVREKDGSTGDDRGYTLSVIGDTSPCATWAREYTPIVAGTDRTIITPLSTADGGFVWTGSFDRGGGQGRDIWLARADATGQVVWQKGFDAGTSNWEVGNDLARTPAGDFIIAGGLFQLPAGFQYGLGMKVDGAGNLLWQTRLGGPEAGTYAIEPTLDGGAILVGEGNPYAEAWIVRLSSTGGVVWSRKYGGASYDFLVWVVATPDGGFAAVGASDSVGQGSFDGWVMKFDGAGDVSWQSVYGGTGDDRLYALTATSDGGLLIGGELDLDFTVPQGQGWIAKLDASGAVLWQRTISFPDAETWVIDTVELADGTLLALGGFDTVVGPSNSSWLARFDAAGELLWQEIYDGTGWATTLFATADGGFLAAASEETGTPTARILHGAASGAIDACTAVRAGGAIIEEASVTRTIADLAVSEVDALPVPAGLTSLSRSGPSVNYCPCATPVYSGRVDVSKVPGDLLVEWTSGGAALFDVVRGDLDVLRSSGGDFAAALAAVPGTGLYTCMANDTSANAVSDALCCPDPGLSFFFLLRPAASLCPGTYDDGSPSQVGRRDEEILGAPDECP